jgi:6,7-dimethyl-8-ribityllumazine synthase
MKENIRIAITVSEFNGDITLKMLDAAKAHAQNLNIKINYVCFAPGVFDMPLIIDELLQKQEVDAVVTLGSVIKGETCHDQVVAMNASRLIADLSLKYHKPVTLGITGPNITLTQANKRIVVVAKRAVDAAVIMTLRLRKLRQKNIQTKMVVVN